MVNNLESNCPRLKLELNFKNSQEEVQNWVLYALIKLNFLMNLIKNKKFVKSNVIYLVVVEKIWVEKASIEI